jgi:hypothetical protein
MPSTAFSEYKYKRSYVCRERMAGSRACSDPDMTKPLYWQPDEGVRRVEMQIADKSCYTACPSSNAGQVLAAVRAGLDAWKNASLPGNESCSDMQFIEGPTPAEPWPTSLDTEGKSANGINTIRWRIGKEWIGMSGGAGSSTNTDALAVTTVTYRINSGVIIDADIDVNGRDFQWTTNGESQRFDIQSTISHELGHVLGFDHSGDQSATMWAYSHPNDVAKRDLAEDDAAIMCYVYPRGGKTPAGVGEYHGALVSGCSAAGSSRENAGGAMLAAIVAGCLRFRRRRLSAARATLRR